MLWHAPCTMYHTPRTIHDTPYAMCDISYTTYSCHIPDTVSRASCNTPYAVYAHAMRREHIYHTIL